ncbi:MAG: hypothetical protein JRJ12_15060, partial [Deltaproteobacteria bacterium]|nr:hypothetical protein [Deltaproteobacteria bacterium]
MQVSATKTNVHAFGLTEAVTLAQERIEALMSLPYAHADLSDGAGSNNGQSGLADNPTDAANPMADHQDPNNPIQIGGFGQQYNVYWNVAQDWPLQNTKTIRVIVTWRERGKWNRAWLDFSKADVI